MQVSRESLTEIFGVDPVPTLANVKRLTPRERQIAELIADGLTVVEASGRLGISHKTGEVYRFNCLRKMGKVGTVGIVKAILLARMLKGEHP
jgi:DNA-binding NarL/FixJ family response regulator